MQKDGKLAASADWATTKNYIRVKPNTTYTQNIRMNSTIVYVVFYDKNKNIISAEIGTDLTSTYNSTTYTTPNNCYYIKTCYNYSSVGNHLFQVEEGTAATTYEPYKSNTLSTPEDLELRGIGNVKDELNVATGEVVQKFTTKTYNGSENWALHATSSNLENCLHFYVSVDNLKKNSIPVSDRYVGSTYSEKRDEEFISVGGSYHLHLNILQSRLEDGTVNSLKKYLSQNPITVQYELEAPTIKTVDLSTTIRPIEGTMHVSTSSQTLPPLLDMSVPVEATSQNLMSFANIVEEEK